MNSSISSSKAIRLCAGIVVLTGLIFLVASEYMLRAVVAPQDEFIAHTRLFNTTTASNAAFGDSHVARGFVPPANMVNLAYPSESIPRMAWKVQTYYADHAPGRVILQADPHMLAPYRLGRTLGDYPEQFRNPTRATAGLYLSIPRYRANLVNYWASFVRNGGRLQSEITFTENGAHLSPGDISTQPLRYRLNAALSRARIHDLGAEETQAEYRDIYADMVTELGERGANLCFVTFPSSPDFRQALATVGDPERADAIVFFKSQAARIGATYVDWEEATDAPSDFRDTDHLNGIAAQRLSPELMTRCFGTAAP